MGLRKPTFMAAMLAQAVAFRDAALQGGLSVWMDDQMLHRPQIAPINTFLCERFEVQAVKIGLEIDEPEPAEKSRERRR
jgi:hypothetical protein